MKIGVERTINPLYHFYFFQLMHLPEEVIVDTTEYKCLQSQFSVLYNDALQIRTSLSETRNLLMTSKNTHLRHLEQLEVYIKMNLNTRDVKLFYCVLSFFTDQSLCN